MTVITRILMLVGILAVSACASTSEPVASSANSWQLESVSVRFGPDVSRTADGQSYSSNFLWNGFGYGDDTGNRKKQVVALFKNAMNDVGATDMIGNRPVKMDVRVNYFHALTYTSRWFCCGAHRIFADITVTDSASGATLAEVSDLALGRIALGGIPAVIAEMNGRDQWVRVREGISDNTRDWLAGF